jgi:hypothetical protein
VLDAGSTTCTAHSGAAQAQPSLRARLTGAVEDGIESFDRQQGVQSRQSGVGSLQTRDVDEDHAGER